MRRPECLALVLLCVFVFMSGGCGGSSSSSGGYVPANANAVWSGSWIASGGTATARAQSVDHALDVQNIAAVFYSCDVEGETGTAKMSALVILSGDIYMPMFFPNLELSTDRVSPASWTAATPHGTLSVNLLSDDRAEFSGSVNYLGYECTFSASVLRTEAATTSLKPENILDGTWKYNAARAGGYRFVNGAMFPLVPRHITMCFNSTDSQTTTMTSAGFIDMPINGSTGDSSINFIDAETPSAIRNIYGDIYAIASIEEQSPVTTLLFVQSTTQIYVLMSWADTDGNMCLLLPMSKVQPGEELDIAAGLGRTWSVVSGGGLMIPSAAPSTQIGFRGVSCDLSFAGVQVSDGQGSAELSARGTVDADTRTLPLSYDGLSVRLEELGVNLWRAVTDKGSRVYISLLSETQALVVADIVYEGADLCLLTAVLAPSE